MHHRSHQDVDLDLAHRAAVALAGRDATRACGHRLGQRRELCSGTGHGEGRQRRVADVDLQPGAGALAQVALELDQVLLDDVGHGAPDPVGEAARGDVVPRGLGVVGEVEHPLLDLQHRRLGQPVDAPHQRLHATQVDPAGRQRRGGAGERGGQHVGDAEQLVRLVQRDGQRGRDLARPEVVEVGLGELEVAGDRAPRHQHLAQAVPVAVAARLREQAHLHQHLRVVGRPSPGPVAQPPDEAAPRLEHHLRIGCVHVPSLEHLYDSRSDHPQPQRF